MGSMTELFNIEAEQTLLGALLVDNEATYKVISFLEPEHFYEPVHQRIYTAILRSLERGVMATAVTLKPQFDSDEALKDIGGASYLAKLSGLAAGLISVVDYGRSVQEVSERRRALNAIDGFRARLVNLEDDVSIAEISSELLKISETGRSAAIRTFAQVSLAEADKLTQKLPCFSTGLSAVDEAMKGGVYQKKSYCFAARPKNGKTMLLSSLAYNMAVNGTRVLYIAAEMGAGEIQQRNLARAIGRNSIAFVANRDDERFVQSVYEAARQQPDTAFYLDAAGITFDELRHFVAQARVRYKIDGFILDYLQLVQGKGRNQNEAEFQAQVAQWIANTCRKDNLFSVYAAQLNREGQVRGSDGIIMAADQVYHLEMNEAKDAAWATQIVSRYTEQRHIGDISNPRLMLDKHGPHFKDFNNYFTAETYL